MTNVRDGMNGSGEGEANDPYSYRVPDTDTLLRMTNLFQQ